MVLACSLVAVPLVSNPVQGIARVHFIDVGQGDAIYIQLPDGKDILIDSGNAGHGDDVVNYLKAQGMDDDIELLIATHPHEDHIGGLPEVLAAFQVDEIIDCGLAVESRSYELYKQAVEEENCSWHADDYQTLLFDGVELQILTGNETWSDINDYSVVTRLDYGEVEAMFMGDAEKEAEACLQGETSAEILKVSHHGSESSSSLDFLSRVKPQVGIISVGEGNLYEHPNGETLTRLQAAGAKIYRTDLNGEIIVTMYGRTYSVRSESNVAGIDAVQAGLI